MRKLVFVSLFSLSAMQLGGCIIRADDDDDDDFGAFDVTWNLDPGCPAGATTAQLVSQEVDIDGNAIGSPIEDLFNCEDGGGTTADLPLGDYDVRAVTTEAVVKVLTPIWNTKPETASRVRQRIEAVLDYATALGKRDGANPARWRGHLAKRWSASPALRSGSGSTIPPGWHTWRMRSSTGAEGRAPTPSPV